MQVFLENLAHCTKHLSDTKHENYRLNKLLEKQLLSDNNYSTSPPITVKYKIVPQIEQHTQQYKINVVEIIGHTDGQGNGSVTSNLDQNLEKVASATIAVNQLKAGSNADLGLMRALAIVQVLRNIQSTSNRLQGLNFRAYSAAQLILPNGNFANVNRNPDATRRRIEVRFTRPVAPIKVE